MFHLQQLKLDQSLEVKITLRNNSSPLRLSPFAFYLIFFRFWPLFLIRILGSQQYRYVFSTSGSLNV